MKKILILLCTSITVITGYGQSYDDGFISSRLSVNTGDEKYVSFINGFRSGINRVKSGDFSTVDAIIAAYGFDVRMYPKLDQLVIAANTGVNSSGFSDKFLLKLKAAVDKTAEEFTDIMQFRQALSEITTGLSLTGIESEALVLLDLGVQEIEKSLIPSERAHANPGDLCMQNKSFVCFEDSHLSFDPVAYLDMNYRKLPRWFICGVGTLGSAILGGLTGAGSGAQVGALLGTGGAAVGAVVGGIAGFVGGTVTGVAIFCQ